MRKILTLCLVHKDPHILLGLKKRGFGEGRWNGFGGKLQEGESVYDAALRELQEEAGITAHTLEEVGTIDFEFEGDPVMLEVHVFRCAEFSGEPAESEEMKPQWFHKDEIPFDSMWPDDHHWFPLFLDGKKFNGKFNFRGHDTILNHELIIKEKVVK